ncbi:hypothetical protein CFC21_035039, partial [Triticum aestivum]
MGDDDVTHFSVFFEVFEAPLLEHLFIRLPDTRGGTAATGEGADIVLEYEITLDHLTFLKVVNFPGRRPELRLLRFVLRRAPVLELSSSWCSSPRKTWELRETMNTRTTSACSLRSSKSMCQRSARRGSGRSPASPCAGRGRTTAGALHTPSTTTMTRR